MKFWPEGLQYWVRSLISKTYYQSRLDLFLNLSGAILLVILTKKLSGTLDHCLKTTKISDWMAHVPDDTKLIHMNLPGTHDTCTCKYC